MSTSKLATEIATYVAKRAEFLEGHPDEFVLIRGDQVHGFFATEIDAIKTGHKKFLDEPFLVRKVAVGESPIYLTSLNLQVIR